MEEKFLKFMIAIFMVITALGVLVLLGLHLGVLP